MHDENNKECERYGSTYTCAENCKEHPCTCSPVEECKNELPQALLSALEYRGFYDCGKYLDDDIIEKVCPIMERLRLSARTEVLKSLLEKLPKGKDYVCTHYQDNCSCERITAKQRENMMGFNRCLFSITDIIKGMMNEK